MSKIKITGKIEKQEKCPLKLKISCSECEYFDGWGFDVERFNKGDNLKGESVFDIYCYPPNIIDVRDLKPSFKTVKK